jgi:hypothetical protein
MNAMDNAKVELRTWTARDIGFAMEEIVARYGREGRVYSVTFTDSDPSKWLDLGKWCVAVMSTDTGKVIARFTQD